MRIAVGWYGSEKLGLAKVTMMGCGSPTPYKESEVRQPKELRAGDYVKLIGIGNAGVETGEIGMVVDDFMQESLRLVFPANEEGDCWSDIDGLWWAVSRAELRLLCRFKEY